MACHISVRDIAFDPSSTEVLVSVTTDIPSHLFIRISSKSPWVHTKPSIRRGVAFAEDVRFCFTVFNDDEQNESGDTLEHTFDIPGWTYCMTKYFYFWGKVAGITCVSTTAPFTYHNDYIEPPHYPFLVGDPPINRSSYTGRRTAYLSTHQPCTNTGMLHTFQVYRTAGYSITVNIGIFYQVTGLTYHCRSHQNVSIPGVAGYHEKAINIYAEAGDLIGTRSTITTIDCDYSGTSRMLVGPVGVNACVTGWEGVMYLSPNLQRISARGIGLT